MLSHFFLRIVQLFLVTDSSAFFSYGQFIFLVTDSSVFLVTDSLFFQLQIAQFFQLQIAQFFQLQIVHFLVTDSSAFTSGKSTNLFWITTSSLQCLHFHQSQSSQPSHSSHQSHLSHTPPCGLMFSILMFLTIHQKHYPITQIVQKNLIDQSH